MNRALIVVVAVIAGALLGAASAALKTNLVPWHPEAAPRETTAGEERGARAPQVAVDGAEHRFGVKGLEEEGRHEFKITNVGTGILRLGRGTTTCSCVLSELPVSEIAPRQSARVTLKWKSKGQAGPYQQSGTVLTNDPQQPRVLLSVKGKYVAPLQAVPAEISLGELSASSATRVTTHIYGYLPGPLDLLPAEFSDPALAKFFQVSLTPLSAEQVKQESGALRGFLAQIEVKSGLPLGRFQQTISFRASRPEKAAAEVMVQGLVSGDLTIVGGGFSPEDQVLRLGGVPGKQGLQRTLLIVARGPYHRNLKLKVQGTEPKFLQARLGATSSNAAGTVSHTPLIIEVAPGTQPADYLGSKRGHIIIETSHPHIPQLRIEVALAVEG